MRRAQPGLGLSPNLLRHFAAATLGITFCIALLAEGNTADAIKETAKRNEGKQAEVDQRGVRKLANNNLTVKSATTMLEDDPPLREQDFGDVSRSSTTRNLGGSMNGIGQLATQATRPEDLLPARQAALRARRQAPPRQPSDAEIARIAEASRIRSGASSVE